MEWTIVHELKNIMEFVIKKNVLNHILYSFHM